MPEEQVPEVQLLEISGHADTYTARDERVGRVTRIVLDPSSRAVSHLVVRKGIVFAEERLVPIVDIAAATSDRVDLREGIDVEDLLPFVGRYYAPLDETDPPAGPQDQGIRLAMPLSGPFGEAMPVADAALVPVDERNIPDRLTVLEFGLPVIASDGHEVGRLERVVTSDSGQPSHIVVEEGGLMPERRPVPNELVSGVAEDRVALGTTRRRFEAIAPLGPDE
jgi:uncharacterized protein YrrD